MCLHESIQAMAITTMLQPCHGCNMSIQAMAITTMACIVILYWWTLLAVLVYISLAASLQVMVGARANMSAAEFVSTGFVILNRWRSKRDKGEVAQERS